MGSAETHWLPQGARATEAPGGGQWEGKGSFTSVLDVPKGPGEVVGTGGGEAETSELAVSHQDGACGLEIILPRSPSRLQVSAAHERE